jgi:hypothetical protein
MDQVLPPPLTSVREFQARHRLGDRSSEPVGRQLEHRMALAEMLFQVLTEREEKNSIAIASNEAFTGWSTTFTDPRRCAAIVDRLTVNRTS